MKYVKVETVGTVLLDLAKTECSKNDLLNAIGMLANILDTKAVDAVEVVRCKDCKYSSYDDSYLSIPICEKLGIYADNDFFCKYGERRESE